MVSPEAYVSARTIEAGCSGGFTGFVEAVAVHRGGQVDYVLLSPSARPGPRVVSKARVEEWFATLERARFFDRESPETEIAPDSVGCGISLKGPGLTHSIDVNAELDTEIRRVFEEVISLIGKQPLTD